MVTVRYCAACGAPRRAAEDRFCYACGAAYPADTPVANGGVPGFAESSSAASAAPLTTRTGSVAAPPRPAAWGVPDVGGVLAAAPPESQRQRPLWAVATLSVCTFGLYLLWWIGASWAEMKRELRDEGMHPFWHAVSLIVPIYGLFRVHAHYATINTMLTAAGASLRLRPGAMVVLVVLFGVLNRIVREDIPAVVWVPLALVATACAAGMVVHGQRGLNTYFQSLPDRTITPRVHPVEWIVIVVGAIIWVLALIGSSIPDEPASGTFV